jgi:hypothetical protein
MKLSPGCPALRSVPDRRKDRPLSFTKRLRGSLWLALSLILVTPSLPARILKTRPTASSTYSPWSAILVGSGLEFQTNSSESEYDYPLLLEYSFSDQLKLNIEPNFVQIVAKSKDARAVGGLGDLETSIQYEFLRERRYRPALGVQGLIKWPTATDPDLGTPGREYSVGLIASKDFVYFNADINVLYTFVEDSGQTDGVQVALAVEWPLNRRFDVIAEVVATIGSGRALGPVESGGGLIEGVGATNGTEGTLGLAWHANKYLKLEQGVIYQSDRSWQFVVGWEWSFGGD